MTRHIKASEFKAKCLSLLDEVQDTGESIIVTKRGKPVARLEPMKRRPKTLFGAMKGSVTILGDIVAPLGDWGEPD
jgi:prevent-host-death family protein